MGTRDGLWCYELGAARACDFRAAPSTLARATRTRGRRDASTTRAMRDRAIDARGARTRETKFARCDATRIARRRATATRDDAREDSIGTRED
jgi:hypothetical protein